MVYRKYIKRIFDLIVACISLFVLSPLLAIVALFVRIKLGSPVLFRQERPGKDGVIFTIYKFRTMSNECDENGEPLPNEVRLGSFGEKLRRLSLDEIPELINIIRGELSFVGPRPLKVEYMPLYNKRQARRHEVIPGLTGLAQIHGRNAISWEEKFELDLKYIEEQSLLLDIRILLRTIIIVLKREGISAKNSVTVDRFTGTPA